MPDARFYRFKIDAPYTPDTMPMTRLAEYMTLVATLLGEPAYVHFVQLEPGSATLVQKIDAPAVPKVRERVDRTRRGDPPADASTVVSQLNRKLREDNGRATFYEEAAEVLQFPGRDEGNEVTPITFGAFNQDGTLDGVVIRIGGVKEVVPVHLESEGHRFICLARRGIARRLAAHIFGNPLRVKGTGTWHVDGIGDWKLDSFTITDFEVLNEDSLTAIVNEIRGMARGGWEEAVNPWAELMQIRSGPEEA